MKSEERGLWHYFNKWRDLDPNREFPRWKGSRLDNSWCVDCKFCCGEQDSSEPFPMALLPNQLGPENKDDFHMLNENTAGLGKEGCKSLTPHGCKLPVEKRPVACGFFPIVLVNGGLYLYQICPTAMFLPLERFYKLAKEVAAYLENFSLSDLKHISISLPDKILSEKYINLHIRIFDDFGKKTIFE